MVAFNYNSAQYQPKYSGVVEQLPEGKGYVGVIVESEQQPTQNDGGMLVFKIQVIDGPLKGQHQIDRLNLHHKKADVVEMANRQLSAYCHVLGVFHFQDTAQLHNIPFKFDVVQQPKNVDFTQIGKIYDINGNEPGKQSGPAQQQAPAPVMLPPAQVAPAGGGWQGQAPAAGPAPGWVAPAPEPQQQPPAQQGGWGGQQQQPPAQGGWNGQQPATGPAGGGWGGGGAAPAQGGWNNR